MARPVTTGTHTVPKEVSALKPKGISCDIKVIITQSKTSGYHKHYYVYESAKTGSGKTIGKIEGGKFCPNKRGIQLLGSKNEEKQDLDSAKKTENEQKSKAETGTTSDKKLDTVKEAAINLNVDVDDIALQVKAYGEYAIVLACTEEVLKKLEKRFSDRDARRIYALSIIYFVQEYTPVSYVKDVFDASILSNKWPSLSISENEVGSFLKSLGQHPAICDSYSQDLINESSGLTAIDGHVILTCSKQNDLADYGNKYQKLKNKQMNVLQAFDAINKVPLTSTTYDGDVVDKISVQDLLDSFHFPENTIFLIDMGFYSEEDMGLYREGGKHFVIPVPDNAVISKAMRTSITFNGRFKYKKVDENGVEYDDTILYRESTVEDLENLYQTILDERTEKKNQEAVLNCKKGEKPTVYPKSKVKRSAYGKDRIVMFRDEDMHDKMVAEYRSEIGTDESHTKEKLAELGPEFGLIIMRTNRSNEETEASALYADYKKRWTIETHYNFVENAIQFNGLQTSDYCTMQGLSFLMIPVGQIKSAFVKRMASTESVSNLSIRECLAKARYLKVVQNQDKKWRISMAPKKKITILHEMGVNVSEDLKKLNMSQL
jgi:hypothetical protein